MVVVQLSLELHFRSLFIDLFLEQLQRWLPQLELKAKSQMYHINWTVQVASTVIAVFGFNGYDYPDKPHNSSFDKCEFCRYAYKTTPGGYPKFFSRKVPQARTENMYIDSTIGCT